MAFEGKLCVPSEFGSAAWSCDGSVMSEPSLATQSQNRLKQGNRVRNGRRAVYSSIMTSIKAVSSLRLRGVLLPPKSFLATWIVSATSQLKGRLQEAAKEGQLFPFYLFCFQTIVEFLNPSLDFKNIRFRHADKQSNVVQEKYPWGRRRQAWVGRRSL